jgi:hypothetical protein
MMDISGGVFTTDPEHLGVQGYTVMSPEITEIVCDKNDSGMNMTMLADKKWTKALKHCTTEVTTLTHAEYNILPDKPTKFKGYETSIKIVMDANFFVAEYVDCHYLEFVQSSTRKLFPKAVFDGCISPADIPFIDKVNYSGLQDTYADPRALPMRPLNWMCIYAKLFLNDAPSERSDQTWAIKNFKFTEASVPYLEGMYEKEFVPLVRAEYVYYFNHPLNLYSL